MEEEKIKSKRGGARPGAGRKPTKFIKPTYKRVKVKSQFYDFIKSQIAIIEATPELANKPCKLDGSIPEEKQIGLQKWKDYDAIKSTYLFRCLPIQDVKMFALAWYIYKPKGVQIDFVQEDKIGIRWNKINDVIYLISQYSFLLGLGEDRLNEDDKKIYNEVPSGNYEIYKWIKNIHI